MISRGILVSRLGFGLLGLGLMIGSARGTTTYSSGAVFAAALGTSGLSQTTVTFSSDTCFLCTSLTDSNVEFDSIQLNIGTPAGWPDGNTLERTTVGGSISINPASTFYAFGFNVVTVSGPALPVDIEYNDGSARDFSIPTSGSVGGAIFFGAISANPITGLQVVGPNSFTIFALDDVTIGSQAPTPDAPTMLLIGSGLTALLVYRRRQRA